MIRHFHKDINCWAGLPPGVNKRLKFGLGVEPREKFENPTFRLKKNILNQQTYDRPKRAENTSG